MVGAGRYTAARVVWPGWLRIFMARDLEHARILIYSHDTFGLGHLRRCRRIAHALVGRFKGLSILILSGSPIIGRFEFRSRVDFVRVPGVIKLRDGDYTALSLHMDLGEVLAMRAALIRETARAFRPGLLLVDKEPLGLRGEVGETLGILKGQGARLVLGLRDVLDAPEALAAEWQRKGALTALEHLYDEILIFGRREIYDPLVGLALSDAVRAKVHFTGYLSAAGSARARAATAAPDAPILVTTGGGGDGGDLVDWVLTAYESDPAIPSRAEIVLGPFMPGKLRTAFEARAARLDRVAVLTFEADLGRRMARAAGIVAMGGYNTFCEILSFDRPALIVPRRVPRLEQHLRARRASELGLVRMLSDEHDRDPWRMAAALRELPTRARPSRVMAPDFLDGSRAIGDRVEGWLQT